MRIHFAAAIAVLVVALWAGVDRLELVALLLAIAFVLIAEMINSAIEAAIDMATSSFDPLAKLAKDIAAGAVLIASINAIAVGYLVFSGHVSELDRRTSSTACATRRQGLTLIALILVDPPRDRDEGAHRAAARRCAAGCPRATRRSRSRRGWRSRSSLGPSEHRFFVSTIMFVVAVLVAHTRIEAGVHSTLEVVYGGAARRRRHPRRLPALLLMIVTVIDDIDRELYERTLERSRRGRTRRTRTSSSAPCSGRATARSSTA